MGANDKILDNGGTDMFYKAAYIPGYKDRFGNQAGWTAFELPDGSVSWQYRDGTFAGVRRMMDGHCVAFATGE